MLLQFNHTNDFCLGDGSRRETSPRIAGTQGWFSLLSNALGKEAVEGKDGYTILSQSPTNCDDGTQDEHQTRRQSVCWQYVGTSVLSLGKH